MYLFKQNYMNCTQANKIYKTLYITFMQKKKRKKKITKKYLNIIFKDSDCTGQYMGISIMTI